VDNLLERTITFAYDYNVTCPSCTGAPPLTSCGYYNELNKAHIICAHCGSDIHFGRAVFALRDAEGPALDDQWTCRTPGGQIGGLRALTSTSRLTARAVTGRCLAAVSTAVLSASPLSTNRESVRGDP
jgi:hypothetical protein